MTELSIDRPKFLPPATADRWPALVAGGFLIIGFLAIGSLVSSRQAALFVMGGLLGAALYHGSFGFTDLPSGTQALSQDA